MPDGSPGGLAGRLARAAALRMEDSLQARAAVAWIGFVAPDLANGAAPDDRGIELHLLLFARNARYWELMCRLFRDLGLSDGGWHG
jgi:hypothetical protein